MLKTAAALQGSLQVLFLTHSTIVKQQPFKTNLCSAQIM